MRISDWSADVCSSDLLFYDEKLYCGLGFDGARFVTHQYGIERARPANPHGLKMRMRVTNDRHIITYDTSGDGSVGLSRSEEHTSELQSLMRISYAVFCLKKKKKTNKQRNTTKYI